MNFMRVGGGGGVFVRDQCVLSAVREFDRIREIVELKILFEEKWDQNPR